MSKNKKVKQKKSSPKIKSNNKQPSDQFKVIDETFKMPNERNFPFECC